MEDGSILERAAHDLCKAIQIEMRDRAAWPIAVETVARRLGISGHELHESIYYAKMQGWLHTSGTPVHSLILRGAGEMAAAHGSAGPTRWWRRRQT